MLRKLFADQCLSRSVVVEREEWTQAQPRSHRKESRVSDDRMASRARQSLILGTSILTSTCDKVKGLNVTLDNSAGFADDLDKWWDVGVWFMGKVNYVLDRAYPEVSGNDWGAISKEENTSKHKCDQNRREVTSPITLTQRLGIGAPMLRVWGGRGQRVGTSWSRPRRLV